jgi:flagellar basal body-associated protein FliL
VWKKRLGLIGMSEEVKEPAKKKGGKLPIIIALVAILGGGGFFMTKGKGGKEKKPAIELGDVQTMPEFLVNLKDGSTYLRTEIALQTAKWIEKEKFDKMVPGVRDAIISTLTSKGIDEIRTLDGKDKLKKQIAKAINDEVDDSEEKDDASDKADKSDDGDKKKKVIDVHIHTDWDSQTGPVLKVFFTSFATQ